MRCKAWHKTHPLQQSSGFKETMEIEAGQLFPPPAFSENLAAGSRWSQVNGKGVPMITTVGLVIVTVGGVYGGSDGPAGLFQYIAGVMSGSAVFLHLDTGHAPDVANAVLRAGLHWLLATYPEVAGRVILAGFSMGSATVVEVGSEFLHALRGLLLVGGQTHGTERLPAFTNKAVLLVHGQEDPNVTVQCSHDMAATASAAGAVVQLEVFAQAPYRPSSHLDSDILERLQRHHLWDERWDVQAVVLQWLREQLRKVAFVT